MWLAVQGEVLDVELLDQSLCVMIIFILPVKVFPVEVGSTYIHLAFVINPTSPAGFLSPFGTISSRASYFAGFLF